MTIDEATEELEIGVKAAEESNFTKGQEAMKLGIEALKLLKAADIEGGMHTFKGESVEQCILIRKSDLEAGPFASLLTGEESLTVE